VRPLVSSLHQFARLTSLQSERFSDLYSFLEAELELVEQIREELLRVKSGWVQSQPSNPPYVPASLPRHVS
jgi:hypothetical protein